MTTPEPDARGDVPAGLTRLGAYTLVQSLAQGGMAEVYLARGSDGHVAVKVLDTRRATEADACQMFLDEARLVALLDHPNIASVLDVDVDAPQGLHYLAMEYVHGRDLREIMIHAAHHNTSLPYEVSLAIVMQAAAGLDHAHRRCDSEGRPLHLVHRDVSLSNIMVGFDGVVKLVDFGIARSTLSTVHTMPGIVRGKASYMSPEQCMGDALDHRTDVFALGVVLYELTTGARCFAGKSDFEKMLAVVRGDYLSPSTLVADYPPELEQIVRCALSTDPALRYPSCAALFDALDRVVTGRGWVGGVTAIRSMMSELFGSVREPWVVDAGEVTQVDHAPAAALPPSPPTTRITRSKRLAHQAIPQSASIVISMQPERSASAVAISMSASASLSVSSSEILWEESAAGASVSGAIVPSSSQDVPTPVSLPSAPLSRGPRPHRFARGSCADVLDPAAWTVDEDDVVTRGRRALRRSWPSMAA